MALAGPSPVDYRERVKEWLSQTLKDPASAQVKEIRAPRRAAHKVDRGFLGHLWDDPAWWVCYEINAKNGFGGYTGNHLYMFAFRNGRLTNYVESPAPGYRGRENAVPDVEHECALAVDSAEGTTG
jgi:hypothetical protein